MKQPNILLIQSDQHHARFLSCAGHAQAATPHLDHLASEGLRFTNAWCQNGICLPSRASMMSGHYPRAFGIYGNDPPQHVATPAPSLAKRLQEAGYHTAVFGKRHLPGFLDGGWDEAATTMIAPWDPSPERYLDWVTAEGYGPEFAADWAAEHDGDGDFTAGPLMCGVSSLPETHTMEAWVANRCRNFLQHRARADRPFFCWCSFHRPHQPYTPLPNWLECFPPERVLPPPSLRENKTHLPPFLQVWRSGGWLARAEADESIYRFYIACYLAVLAEVDHHVGRVLACLQEEGLAENTLVVYTSDHGEFVGEHGMAEKCAAGHNIYSATLRVPLILRWPGRIGPGGLDGNLVELTDLLPTLLAATGLPPDPTLPGFDLLGAEGNCPWPRQVAFSENALQSCAIDNRYTLGIWRGQDWHDMLFDRHTDPWELENRAGDPALAVVERRLRAAWTDWDRAGRGNREEPPA